MVSDPPEGRYLTFLVSLSDEAASGDKGIFGSVDRDLIIQSMPVADLKRSLRTTIDRLSELFQGLDQTILPLPLKEFQVCFEVTATGKVVLLGTGAEVAGKGAITLTFGRVP